MGGCFTLPRDGYEEVPGRCRNPRTLQKQKQRRLATAQSNKEARSAREARDAERKAQTKKKYKEFKEQEQAIIAKYAEKRSDRRRGKNPNGA